MGLQFAKLNTREKNLFDSFVNINSHEKNWYFGKLFEIS